MGFTCSTFDLLHAGHVMMLREAKDQCDYLLVGLQSDPTIDRPEKNKPIQSLPERYIQLSAVKYVDEIIPYTTEADLIDILNLYPIDVRIIGKEYEHSSYTGRNIRGPKDMETYYNFRTHNFSTSELRNRVANAECPVYTKSL